MENLLVAIDHSLEASIALRIACRFGSNVRIQPLYVPPSPGHDLAIGAGWARKTWEKENLEKARENIKDLLVPQGDRCPFIEGPVLSSGEPVKTITGYFFENDYDMLITGAPFRGLETLVLAHRFRDAVRKAPRDLPLLVVQHLNTIRKTLVVTDGGDEAEKALGLLNRISPLLSEKITLVGLAGKKDGPARAETLSMERGLAILKEKDIDAAGYTARDLKDMGVKTEIRQADLLVLPISSDTCVNFYKSYAKDLDSVLFYMSRD